MCVAHIAQHDFPEAWPQLFEHLLICLRQKPGKNSFTLLLPLIHDIDPPCVFTVCFRHADSDVALAGVSGSMRCLSLMADHFCARQLPPIATVLFPELLRVYTDEVGLCILCQTETRVLRRGATMLVTECSSASADPLPHLYSCPSRLSVPVVC